MGRVIQFLIAILLTLLVYRIYVALKRYSERAAAQPVVSDRTKTPWVGFIIAILLLFVAQLVLGEILGFDPDMPFFGGKSLLLK